MRFVNLAMMVFGYIMFVYLLVAVIQDLRKKRANDQWLKKMEGNLGTMNQIHRNNEMQRRLQRDNERLFDEEVQRRRDIH